MLVIVEIGTHAKKCGICHKTTHSHGLIPPYTYGQLGQKYYSVAPTRELSVEHSINVESQLHVLLGYHHDLKIDLTIISNRWWG
jgi:hypothetical protein